MVNEENKTFNVTDIVITLWNVCDGKTESEIVEFFVENIDADNEKVEKSIKAVIAMLVKFGMLEENE